MHIVFDLASIKRGKFSVRIEGHAVEDIQLKWDAIAKRHLIGIENVQGLDVSDIENIFIRKGAFEISYDISPVFEDCVGGLVEVYLTPPFVNEYEVFISAGVLPVPVNEPSDIRASIKNIPDEWHLSTNLMPLHSSKFEGFFIYASPTSEKYSTSYQYEHGGDLNLTLRLQHGKTIPVDPDAIFEFIHKWLRFLEINIMPYDKTSNLTLLILQTPNNFTELIDEPVFATGENMMNAIVCYAPNDATYLSRLFGYQDYGYFLIEGLVHELAHLYASSGDAEGKAYLYANASASRHDRMLIGESLPGYIHRLYMFEHYYDDLQRFFTQDLRHNLNMIQRRPRPYLVVKWLILDIILQQEYDTSVLNLFAMMVRQQKDNQTPFESVELVFEALKQMGIHADKDLFAFMYADFEGDLVALLGHHLNKIGLALETKDDTLQITGDIEAFSLSS